MQVSSIHGYFIAVQQDCFVIFWHHWLPKPGDMVKHFYGASCLTVKVFAALSIKTDRTAPSQHSNFTVSAWSKALTETPNSLLHWGHLTLMRLSSAMRPLYRLHGQKIKGWQEIIYRICSTGFARPVRACAVPAGFSISCLSNLPCRSPSTGLSVGSIV